MIATIPKCRCGSEMYAGPSGWVCSECDRKIVPYAGRKAPKTAKRIVHDPTEDCKTCSGTGLIECEECLGDCVIECPHCGQEMDCEECDGEGKVSCPDCDD